MTHAQETCTSKLTCMWFI